jgi:putative chitinase
MLLKVGSKGEDVKKLQEKLGTSADGSFGPGTEKLVKEWQSKNGLTADGIIGDSSWAKLFGPETITSKPVANVVIPPSDFKLEKLKGHVPDSVIAQIPDTAAKFNITNPLRLAHFLAQCGHESTLLLGTFGKYFDGTTAAQYEKKPEMIASRVYGNRMGNGDESTKEGYKFRGRGYIQLTGKSNYTKFAQFIGEDTVGNPDLVATKYPLASAAFFFDSNKLWSICDKGADDATVTSVTKRVNGGTIGLPDRIKHFNEYYNLLK